MLKKLMNTFKIPVQNYGWDKQHKVQCEYFCRGVTTRNLLWQHEQLSVV